jgi:hypothetical protein
MWREGRCGRLRLSAECRECSRLRAAIKCEAPAGFVPAGARAVPVPLRRACARMAVPGRSSVPRLRSPGAQASTGSRVGSTPQLPSRTSVQEPVQCGYHFRGMVRRTDRRYGAVPLGTSIANTPGHGPYARAASWLSRRCRPAEECSRVDGGKSTRGGLRAAPSFPSAGACRRRARRPGWSCSRCAGSPASGRRPPPGGRAGRQGSAWRARRDHRAACPCPRSARARSR